MDDLFHGRSNYFRPLIGYLLAIPGSVSITVAGIFAVVTGYGILGWLVAIFGGLAALLFALIGLLELGDQVRNSAARHDRFTAATQLMLKDAKPLPKEAIPYPPLGFVQYVFGVAETNDGVFPTVEECLAHGWKSAQRYYELMETAGTIMGRVPRKKPGWIAPGWNRDLAISRAIDYATLHPTSDGNFT